MRQPAHARGAGKRIARKVVLLCQANGKTPPQIKKQNEEKKNN
jgi:hypothetical protein